MARNAKNTRMCSGCMSRRDKSDFVCIYNSTDGIKIGNPADKTSGRSAYLCKNEECMEKAIKRKWISRSLKTELPNDFYDNLRSFFKTQIRE